MESKMNLLDLPECVLEEIFSYFTFDEIAKFRLINTQVDKICQGLLNRGFYKMMKKHAAKLKEIKSKLPRRESERRNHPLSKHVDILTCVETRISMLSLTYSKYIDLKLCCFIPGKVIDEVMDILKLVATTPKLVRTHEVLQELRDISSMAIEHFDEKIAVLLKKSFLEIHRIKQTTYQSPYGDRLLLPSTSSSCNLFPNQSLASSSSTPISTADQTPIQTIHLSCVESKKNTALFKVMKRKYQTALLLLNQVQNKQQRQTEQIKSFSAQITELSSQIIELKRRLEESDAKNRELSTNFSKTADNSPPKMVTNIKPRTATIILKRRITEQQGCSNARDNKNKKLKPNDG